MNPLWMAEAMRQVLDDQIRRFGRILHYAGVLATVIGMAASYSLWHVPLLVETDRTDEKIQELTLSVQNAQAIREQYEKVSERLATAKAQIATVKQRVPQEADPGQFFDEVSRIAVEETLAIKDYEKATPVVHEGYTQMEVTLTGRGNYAAVCTFLDRLAGMKRLSKLQNLTLTASGNATEYPMTATLIIYFGLRGTDETDAKEVKRG
jgi:Tfp pilus assembly protein PilO